MLNTAGVRLCAPIAMVLMVAACGGGGGGGGGGGPSTPNDPPPQSQTITFDNPGPVTLLVGASVANTASGGSGSGDITYASSDGAVATVDAATGEVMVEGPGSVDITATKAADDDYLEAEASYRIDASEQTSATAWVGEDASELTFAAVAEGATFVRSTEPDCDLDNVGACSNGQSDEVTDAPLTDTTLNLASTGYHYLRSGSRTSDRVVAGVERFSPRIGHAVVRFDGRYWLIGGGITTDAGNIVYGDVWASDDAVTWELMQATPAFGNQWFHQLAVFDGRMWLFTQVAAWSSADGVQWDSESAPPFFDLRKLNVVTFQGILWAVYDGTAYSSDDGVSWTTRSPVGAAGRGNDHETLTVFDGALWLVGGNDGSDSSSEVWTSADGVDWTLATDAGFPARTQHTSFVLDDRLWVFGGITEAGGGPGAVSADAWHTDDGSNWEQADDVDLLSRIYLAQAVASADGAVNLLGGVRIGFSNQVWRSADGLGWTQLSPHGPFSAQYGARAVAFDGALWLVGGNTQIGGVGNQVWRSTDGSDWDLVEPDGDGFTPVSSHGLAVFDDRIWVVGGWDGSEDSGGSATPTSQVWSSPDGAAWTRHDGGGAIFSPRLAHSLTSFAGRLWAIGGQDASGTALAEVWSSSDGESWTEETGTPEFGQRVLHGSVAFDGALWLFGGSDGTAPRNDVWSSVDGVTWTEAVAVGDTFSPRLGHSTVVHDDRMWLAGGTDSSDYEDGVAQSDVWWTLDGENWTRAAADAPFAPRWSHALVSHDDVLWVLAGFDRTLHDDVWRSEDGVDWQLGYRTSFSLP